MIVPRGWREVALLRGSAFGFCNGGWNHDAYPELEPLDAGRRISIAEIAGPAAVTHIHITQHSIRKSRRPEGMTDEESRALCARGVMLEIFYDGSSEPSVRVPLADFFADGCGGMAADFSSLYVEKAPGAYNSFFPMPFRRSVRLALHNETRFDLDNYSYVELERLPGWEEPLGYFHADWKRFAFPLCAGTDQEFFRLEGAGKLMGRAWSVATDEPLFRAFHFVMEGNNEVRIDGEQAPRADYLGSECSFGFCWGFPRVFSGLRNGINFVQPENPSRLSVYRFRDNNAIEFERGLEWRVDWTHEFHGNDRFQREMAAVHAADGGWIDYAATTYWYGREPTPSRGPYPALDERVKPLLHPNRGGV